MVFVCFLLLFKSYILLLTEKQTDNNNDSLINEKTDGMRIAPVTGKIKKSNSTIMATNDRLYKTCYTALKIFHWILFVVTVEIAFWFAGWILFGIMDGGLVATPSEANQDNAWSLTRIGQYMGLVSGLGFNWYILSNRYRHKQ